MNTVPSSSQGVLVAAAELQHSTDDSTPVNRQGVCNAAVWLRRNSLIFVKVVRIVQKLRNAGTQFFALHLHGQTSRCTSERMHVYSASW
jgi:hypothetical protein